MKRLTVLIISLAVFLFFTLFSPALAHPEVTVLLDGLPVNFDVPPLIQNDRTMAPFRFIAEALNVEVEWDGQTRTVIAKGENRIVMLQIDNTTAYIDGNPVTLDAAPVLVSDRTLIPVRFFSEAFDCEVEWMAEDWTVIISSPPREMSVIGFYALGDTQTSSWTNLFTTPYPVTDKGHTDIVSELALGWYTVNEKGELLTRSPRTAWQKPPGWQDILGAANLYGLGTEMVIHETDRGGLLTTLLGDTEAMAALIRMIMGEVVYFNGVNLDLEGLGPAVSGEQLQAVQQSFTTFVSLLAAELKPAGKTLTLTLHPPNSYYKGYDYKALGELADRIVIMAYDYGPKPEPVDRVLRAVEMAAAVVLPEKLILGISVPNETPESIMTKLGIAKRYNINGIALWRLGLLTPEMWHSLGSGLNY